MILTIRTDSPETELSLFKKESRVDYLTWNSGKKLSDDLLKKIESFLKKNNSDFSDVESIVVFKGPGSYTGLRIGITVANTLAYSLNVPIVSGEGDKWIEDSMQRIENGENEKIVSPEYGGEANITKPRK